MNDNLRPFVDYVRIQSNVPNDPRALFRGKQDQIVFYGLVHAVESGVIASALGRIPDAVKAAGKTTYRSLKIDDEEFEFSDGFTDLHKESYERILKGEGFGIKDAFPSIDLVHTIRNTKPQGLKGDYHPFAKQSNSTHPFFRRED